MLCAFPVSVVSECSRQAAGTGCGDGDLAISRILKCLGVNSVALITNNPEKIDALSRGGIRVARRIPLVVSPNRFNAVYLKTKRSKLGHLSAEETEEEHLPLASSEKGRKG